MHLFFVLISLSATLFGYMILSTLFPVFKENTYNLYLLSFLFLITGIIIFSIIICILAILTVIFYYIFLGIKYLYDKILKPTITPIFINNAGEDKTQLSILYRSAKEKWCKKII